MSRLTPLLTQRITRFERQLLEQGAREQPRFGTSRRMARALGISPLVLYSSVAKALVGSWLGNLGIAVVLGGGIAVAVSEPGGSEPGGKLRAPAATSVAVQKQPREAASLDECQGDELRAATPSASKAPAAACQLNDREPAKAPAPVTLPTIRSKQAASHATAKAAGNKLTKRFGQRLASKRATPKHSSLTQEISLLDRARVLINDGKMEQGLSLLNIYRQRFPAGVLARESELLRQRAL
jgi:hypothetical protein